MFEEDLEVYKGKGIKCEIGIINSLIGMVKKVRLSLFKRSSKQNSIVERRESVLSKVFYNPHPIPEPYKSREEGASIQEEDPLCAPLLPRAGERNNTQFASVFEKKGKDLEEDLFLSSPAISVHFSIPGIKLGRRTLLFSSIVLIVFLFISLFNYLQTRIGDGEFMSLDKDNRPIPIQTTYPAKEDTVVFLVRVNKESLFGTHGVLDKFAMVKKAEAAFEEDVSVRGEVYYERGLSDTPVDNMKVEAEKYDSERYKVTVGRRSRNEFHPGKYTLVVYVKSGEKVRDLRQDFNWGVLAFNTNKSVYAPGERARIDFAVLDERGSTICDAKLTLRIQSHPELVSGSGGIPKLVRNDVEELTTENGGIKTSGKCNGNNITDTPDYTAYYQTDKEGKYVMTVKAVTKNGEYEITDFYNVKGADKAEPFVIERIGPTRINPTADYKMTIKIKANRDFEGEIIETVPLSFAIKDINTKTSGSIDKSLLGVQYLIWEKKMYEGDIFTIEYTFDAPNISPEFFLLGPLQIQTSSVIASPSETREKQSISDLNGIATSPSAPRNDNMVLFQEPRYWQIASDAVGYMIAFWDGAGAAPSGWDVVSDNAETYYQKFLRGSSSAGGTGGNATHTHTLTTTATSQKAADSARKASTGGGTVTNTAPAHTHSVGTFTGLSGSNIPLYRSLKVIKYNSTTPPSTIPNGVIVMNDGTWTTDSNWTQYTDENTYFLCGYSSAGATGASDECGAENVNNQHAHTIGATVGGPVEGGIKGAASGGLDVANNTHTHTMSGQATNTVTYQPAYGEVILYKNTSGGDVTTPIGMTILFDGDAPTNWNRLSAYDGKILKAVASCTGTCTTGGGGTHTHTNITGVATSNEGTGHGAYANSAGTSASVLYPHTHTIDLTFGTAITEANMMPPYRDVVVAKYDPPISNQRNGIIQNDETGRTISTPYTARKGERLRVKIQVDTNIFSTISAQLEFDKNGDADWTRVSSNAEIRPALSTVIHDKYKTGSEDSGTCYSGTKKGPGIMVEGKSRTPVTFGALTRNTCREVGFVIDTKNASVGTKYRFRVYDAMSGGALTSYYVYPTVSVVADSSNNERFSKTNQFSLSTNTNDLPYFLDKSGYTNVLSDDDSREVLQNVTTHTGLNVDTSSSINLYGTENDYNYLGWSVALAGDVNGDGYSDVVVGAPGASVGGSYMGRVYIFYGSSSFSDFNADTSADVNIYATENDGQRLGNSVAGAGDVNGDGYDDVIVGSRQANVGGTSKGRAYIFYGGSLLTGKLDGNKRVADTSADVSIYGTENDNQYLGWSVAGAGDVNGDGYNDVIVGARQASVSGGATDYKGRAYIFYGGSGLSGLKADTSANVNIYGTENNSQSLGSAVATAGDVNGDGYDDVIVGAYGASVSGGATDYKGRAYIFYGGSGLSGLKADTSANVNIYGTENNLQYLGFSVAGVGDVNGDGYSDVGVGADGANSGGSYRGRVYIFYGASGLSGLKADTSANVNIYGTENTSQHLGYSIAQAGDVNGDGYSDIIVGAYGASVGGGTNGRAYIFYGSSTLAGLKADTSADVNIYGTENDSQAFGGSVAGAGDVNGDGYDDVIVGAYTANAGGTEKGRAYVYLMSYQGLSGASADTTADTNIYGTYTGTPYLGISVAGAGDVNGDGYDDVIVGAYMAGTTVSSGGRAFLFYGSQSFSGVKADNTADAQIYGTYNSSEFLGWSVASAGDVNGDGYDDVIVGGYWADVTSTTDNRGRAFIFYGSSTFSGLKPDNTADVQIYGTYNDDESLGYSVSSAGDVNGDGYADVIVGAWFAGVTSTTDHNGRAFIFYGGPLLMGKLVSRAAADNQADAQIYGTYSSGHVGYSVASAGDVNGDGYDDVITGADFANTTVTAGGRAFIFYGGSLLTGKLVSGAVADRNSDAQVYGTYNDDEYLGRSVASAGDMNGDGYDDVIVGAGYANTTVSSGGRALIFYGASNFSGAKADSTADAQVFATYNTSEYLGRSVASAGDVNGDGYDDVIVGAYGAGVTSTTDNRGRALIFYGASNFSGAKADSTADAQIYGAHNDYGYLGYSVSSAGDVNGDGYSDIIMGAYQAGVTAIDDRRGRAFVYYGGGTSSYPTFNFAKKMSSNCSSGAATTALWQGVATQSASLNNIFLQAYRFGSTNAWTTLTRDTSLASNTEGNITGSITSSVSEYCSNDWMYFRVYQDVGGTLKTDYFTTGNDVRVKGNTRIKGDTRIR